MMLAKYTWKNFGISLHDLKYNTSLDQFLQYEEEKYISEELEYADYKDQPKPNR